MADYNFKELEKEILGFWKKNKIFEKSVDQRKNSLNFVFYEGPPTANAKPGLHHVLARVFKDIICRYKTMKGFKVERKAGWDTHGLPVELQTEKKLGLRNKKEIEEYSISKFNEECKKSVWEYVRDWQDLTEKIGFWLDMKNPYITYDPKYIESVWYILKKIWQKKLLYQDFKVVAWCPRCQTALSSHEVSQGYKKITEPAIFVKLQVKNQPPFLETKNKNSKTYLLSWTTTPWTLPGNVALAINSKIIYAKVKINDEFLILAKSKIKEIIGEDYQIIKEFSGKELLEIEYQPLFEIPQLKNKKSYKVYQADFVKEEEGTGIVHIAVMYGQDDFELGKKIGLPKYHLVDLEGKFKKELKGFEGSYVKDKKTEILIFNYLKEKNLLFKKENYTHDYPFCWRCETCLLYYARDSWFIKTSVLKNQLLKNNKKINWLPSHIKEGRFGEWLRKIKDWTLSRERFWGTPLPIWQCQNNKCNNLVFIGSIKELLEKKFTNNQYYLLRHGQTPYQKEKRETLYSLEDQEKIGLTKEGKEQTKRIAKILKKEKIDLIFSSDFKRAKETAKVIAKELGLPVVLDKRLRDLNLGIYHGRLKKDYFRDFPKEEDRLKKAPPKGEKVLDCGKRILDFLFEIDKIYENKKILIVSHGYPLWFLEQISKGLDVNNLPDHREEMPKIGELRKIEWKFLPLNEKIELDLHRPYIDKIRFICFQCQEIMKRVPEVIDAWFDSGAMPFAQNHWPFDQNQILKIFKKEPLPKLFPGDYITEGVDQTRGWFYTLLAISTLLGFGPAFKNVISLGHVLDEKGEKMSKSKGNVVDPWQMLEKYGADAIRWYFFTVNQPGDSKLFSERDLQNCLKRFIIVYWNCYQFFEISKENSKSRVESQRLNSKSLLDKWILSRLNQLIKEITQLLEAYQIVEAARKIENFVVEDLSQWYIRRSRRRFQKPKNSEERKTAIKVLYFVLTKLTQITAPFIPFLSEKIYKELHPKTYLLSWLLSSWPESVHLTDWPEPDLKLIDLELEKQINWARKIVYLGHQARAKAKIKVRQPLPKIKIEGPGFLVPDEILELIKEELNIKKVILEARPEKEFELDTTITPELKKEGYLREFIHSVQVLRKEKGLHPSDKILLTLQTSPVLSIIFSAYQEFLAAECNIKKIIFVKKISAQRETKEIKIDGEKLKILIKKVQTVFNMS